VGAGLDFSRVVLLTIAIHDVDYLVQMRIDCVRKLIEVTPLLAEFRRFMSRLQEIAALPLDIVDDAPPIETAVHADGYEAGLARHEAGPFCHQ